MDRVLVDSPPAQLFRTATMSASPTGRSRGGKSARNESSPLDPAGVLTVAVSDEMKIVAEDEPQFRSLADLYARGVDQVPKAFHRIDASSQRDPAASCVDDG